MTGGDVVVGGGGESFSWEADAGEELQEAGRLRE